jgi:flagellar biosynthetic protein FlhB
MAEDLSDKTEAPTPRRRQEAREEGNIARSPDLTAAVVLLSLLFLMDWYGPRLVDALRTLLAESLGQQSLGEISSTGMLHSIAAAVRTVAVALAPLLAGTLVIAIAINLVQVGFFFSPKRLAPNLGALNPLNGWKRIFGGGSGLAHLVMGLLKLALVTLVAYSAVHGRIAQIVTAQQLSLTQAFGLGASIIFAILLRITILLLVLAIIDYAWQRYRMEQKLRMSKQEVKEEMHRMEGDPKIKHRRRQIAMQMLQQRLKKDVPTADVVVTNPTEFAVALKYDSSAMHAPKVIAKGQGFLAQRIREIAIAHGVPILERKPLARALYRLVDVGQEIPEQFYSAVAEILAYVYELSGKARRRLSA